MTEEKTRFDTREDVRKFIEEEVLTSTEAAEVLGVSRARVSQLIGEGKLVPAKKLRGDSLFYRKDVLEKLEELKEKRVKYRPYDSQ